MLQYRRALARVRAGDSKRYVARSGLKGRRMPGRWRARAAECGWLDPQAGVPEAATAAAAVRPEPRASRSVPGVEPWREPVPQGPLAGARERRSPPRNAATTSTPVASPVARMSVVLRGRQPAAVTVRLDLDPGEAAQVNSDARSVLAHPEGKMRRTSAFVMSFAGR